MYTTMNSCVPERRLRTLILAVALLATLPLAASERRAMPSVLPDASQPWQVLGEADLRWLGLRVYDAALWVANGDGWAPDRLFALEIRYGRAIASWRLVDTSVEEMRRLGVADEQQLSAWRDLLEAAFPDVERDDTIIGLRRADGSVSFYHRGAPTIRIDDPQFAGAFFAIWLDERTREPDMRARLLGLADER